MFYLNSLTPSQNVHFKSLLEVKKIRVNNRKSLLNKFKNNMKNINVTSKMHRFLSCPVRYKKN